MTRTIKLSERYDFLLKVPYINVKELTEDDRECYVCKEPYNGALKEWAPGEPIHYPVRLPCGHHIGLQCLTRWLLSANYDNHCPMDRVKLVTHTQHVIASEDSLFLKMLEGFLDPVNEARKSMLLHMLVKIMEGRGSTDATSNRIFILFELFLDHMAINGHLGDRTATRPRGVEFEVVRVGADIEPIVRDLPENVRRVVLVPPRRNLLGAMPPLEQPPQAGQPHPFPQWIPRWLSDHLPSWPSRKEVDQVLSIYGWGFICSAFTALEIHSWVPNSDRGLQAIKKLPQAALVLYCLSLLSFSLLPTSNSEFVSVETVFLAIGECLFHSVSEATRYLGLVAFVLIHWMPQRCRDWLDRRSRFLVVAMALGFVIFYQLVFHSLLEIAACQIRGRCSLEDCWVERISLW